MGVGSLGVSVGGGGVSVGLGVLVGPAVAASVGIETGSMTMSISVGRAFPPPEQAVIDTLKTSNIATSL
jgi:hypothetical protein